MNIASLCERDIVTLSASASVREAACAMRDLAVAGEIDALAGTLRTGVVREASRLRGQARAQSEAPRTLYIAHNEP